MQKSIRSISRQGGFIQWDFQKRIVCKSLLTVKKSPSDRLHQQTRNCSAEMQNRKDIS